MPYEEAISISVEFGIIICAGAGPIGCDGAGYGCAKGFGKGGAQPTDCVGAVIGYGLVTAGCMDGGVPLDGE